MRVGWIFVGVSGGVDSLAGSGIERGDTSCLVRKAGAVVLRC